MRLRGRSVAASPALALKFLEGRSDGACSGCCVVGLAGGARVDWLWGKAQADVRVPYGSAVPWSVPWLWVSGGELSSHCGCGGVGELTLQPAAAVAKHECTLLQTSHPGAP